MKQNNLYVASAAIPELTVRLGGVIQNQAPPPPPKIMIRINGEAVREYQARLAHGTEGGTSGVSSNSLDDSSSLVDDSDDLMDSVDQLDTGAGSEDGPDWMFEVGETLVRNPEYTFCPAPHRKQLLHLFTKHFCSHQFFPTIRRYGGACSAAEIERDSVYDMYHFCYSRGLREVWAYMWNSWYCPAMWKLWARSSTPSSSPYLTRLQTTMNVENFWKQLKHEQLHHLLHPRLDQLVFILIYKVTPMYAQRMDFLAPETRLGRSKPPTPLQTSFKKNWAECLAKRIRDSAIEEYKTDLETWTCHCGVQMYNRHHICQHLVHLVESTIGKPPPKFWIQVSRQRVKPLYRHEALQRSSLGGDSGSITDGDDNIFYGNQNMLGGGGGWKEIPTKSLVPGKRYRGLSDPAASSEMPDTMNDNTTPASLQISRSTRWRLNVDSTEDNGPESEQLTEPSLRVHDNTYNSPDVLERLSFDASPLAPDLQPEQDLVQELYEEEDGYHSSQPTSSRATSPSNYEEDQIDKETGGAVSRMLERADELEKAARIIWEQAPYKNGTWFKSLDRRDIGRDTAHQLKDLRLQPPSSVDPEHLERSEEGALAALSTIADTLSVSTHGLSTNRFTRENWFKIWPWLFSLCRGVLDKPPPKTMEGMAVVYQVIAVAPVFLNYPIYQRAGHETPHSLLKPLLKSTP
ncbi:hypothetical protein AAF712_016716 [Marasmius tenuissimus]|uniref:SWIM-type domain-containing protein n=1 Tax=Marasmius tenuissimus TaxID=585030 RepID=A0ABR2Z600_9AGAR